MQNVRNFSIIAHVDHGKSTLSDRLLEFTNTIPKRKMKAQYLDTLDTERDRGITIKLQTRRMEYKGYILNLIDTPGHVDFSSEVIRSLRASEGALLLVDATSGIGAQSISHYLEAINLGIKIIPVLNKIDVKTVNIDDRINEIMDVFGFKRDEILMISAKRGDGIESLLEKIISDIPSPKGDINGSFRGYVFDAFFDEFRGTVLLVKVVDGTLSVSDTIYFHSNGKSFKVMSMGFIKDQFVSSSKVKAGDVCFITTSAKLIKDIIVEDTILTDIKGEALFNFEKPKSMVFSNIYPTDPLQINNFKFAIDKFSLTDYAFEYSPISNDVFGFGYKCGFLGILHLEVFKERMFNEFGIDIFVTYPSVEYQFFLKDGSSKVVTEAVDISEIYPSIVKVKEPFLSLDIIVDNQYYQDIISFVLQKRGVFRNSYILNSSSLNRVYVNINFTIPLSSILMDFFGELKSISSGSASMDYSFLEFRDTEVSFVNFFVNKNIIKPLSMIVYKDNAFNIATLYTEKLASLIPRAQFNIPVQGSVNSKIVARSDVKPYRKDVTQKLYGGDPTRRAKLLEKQKKGKKKMKNFGTIDLPTDIFVKMYS
ncbi:translation elongation factor 4 [Patescibacteria group bacterium]|nr:translation elongation factor 4 [Patescibacteria group bacterium]